MSLLVACDHSRNKTARNENGTGKVETRKFNTKTGKLFEVHIDRSLSASLNEVKVITKKYDTVNDTFNLGSIDPVKNIFLADLDSNGFEELYLETRSVGSGSYSNLYGWASNKDKSVSPVYIPAISKKEQEEGELFNGFMGHNTFKIENKKLVNEFPVFLEGDTNANATGGTRKVVYELIAGEAGWQLVPNKD